MSRPQSAPNVTGSSRCETKSGIIETMKMTEREIRETRKRFRAAKATQACEGIALTQEEEALFNQMIDDGLPPAQRLEKLRAYIEDEVRPASDTSE